MSEQGIGAAAGRKHQYAVEVKWTGNLGSGTASYRGYSRDHLITGENTPVPIAGSSDPAFRGNPSRYSPEDLLVAALASCHMLSLLHLCADAGIVVTAYTDEATGTMVEGPDGSGRFVEVTLHPRMVITDSARIEEAEMLHERAHQACFIANSVNFPVAHKPVVTCAPPAQP